MLLLPCWGACSCCFDLLADACSSHTTRLATPIPPHISLPSFIIRACRLQSLANAVMTLVDAIVKTSQGQLKQSSSVLQEIMTAAADERGEWLVPLTSQQLESMSQVRCRRGCSLLCQAPG